MSLMQFVRILWARRWLTVGTTLFTVAGAIIAILIIPPSYEAHSRVMLNTLKPDPVTGQVISSISTRTYVATQTELIKDFGVTGQAVDALGWADEPTFIEQYRASKSDLDIRRWLAQIIAERTKVVVVTGTNILEISYRAAEPNQAKGMADALRNAYIDANLASI